MATVFPVKEGSNYDITFTPLVDTTGLTLSVRAYLTTATSGTGTVLGTASGVSANTDVTITAVVKDLSVGNYYLEFFGDYGLSTQVVLNNGGEDYVLNVEDMRTI